MKQTAVLVLLAALTGPAIGCSSGGAPRRAIPASATVPDTPMRFRTIERELRAGLAEAQRRDTRALRRRSPRISNEGLALIKAVLPHDVSRTDVPRYLEGRARFGASLKRWVTAVESGTDQQVIDAIYDLDSATRGWIDAYLGLAPETSV